MAAKEIRTRALSIESPAFYRALHNTYAPDNIGRLSYMNFNQTFQHQPSLLVRKHATQAMRNVINQDVLDICRHLLLLICFLNVCIYIAKLYVYTVSAKQLFFVHNFFN